MRKENKKPIEITRAIVGTIALSKMKNNSVLTIVGAKKNKEQHSSFFVDFIIVFFKLVVRKNI